MNFLVVLGAWGLLQWLGPSTSLHRDHWLFSWYHRASTALAAIPQPFRLALAVAAPALLAGLIAIVLGGAVGGVPLFLFGLLVLAYSLGRGDFQRMVDEYLERWSRGDLAAAYESAVALQILRPDEVPADAAVTDAVALHHQVRAALLYRGYERWFAVVFWFVLLGPAGALGYRTLQLLRGEEGVTADERAALSRWLHWADWVPVRLLGLAFAFTGTFSACFRRFCDSLSGGSTAPVLLAEFENAALEGAVARRDSADSSRWHAMAAQELLELRALLSRSSVAWLVALAILQLL